MGPLTKLPVFLFASAIALSDGRKGASASAVQIAPSEIHIALSIKPQKKADAKVWSNNLAAKLSKTGTGREVSEQGRTIGRLSQSKERRDI
ncbi:hypothetical protein Z949_419 [Sulfitobacter guttiformis KCTC 32187]|uniref:Uncharacterized protein n=1 Tax=Sulfitobacter guttiformis TaxID=74349 RepID=A0A420DTS0_9RHOB|nr:hypothetical protein Z949_419 [Sulfitobacter guttiformis KCTC 32187]RKE97721.1 hypothetical protein C8N30_2343 [Sulfitobacter guttiformis]